eukprot:TRINITY_DN7525_c0_g2_i1.p1 TRINITY_DN7525_c0_g2~~TRINITY_DN7525_c0_g2_i1.p1  ORF type:complete len:155 (+),score=17.08 TRINITY_DN7525_c0_g2_i1:223-687(+)
MMDRRITVYKSPDKLCSSHQISLTTTNQTMSRVCVEPLTLEHKDEVERALEADWELGETQSERSFVSYYAPLRSRPIFVLRVRGGLWFLFSAAANDEPQQMKGGLCLMKNIAGPAERPEYIVLGDPLGKPSLGEVRVHQCSCTQVAHHHLAHRS